RPGAKYSCSGRKKISSATPADISSAMADRTTSRPGAEDNLQQAYSLRAAVCHSVETKQRPSRLAANTGFSVSKKAGIRPAGDGAAQDPLKPWSLANPLGHKSKCDVHGSLRQRNLHLAIADPGTRRFEGPCLQPGASGFVPALANYERFHRLVRAL